MVDPDSRRARYIAGSEGAPPVPPPGGYRGARRPRTDPATVPGAPLPRPARRDPGRPRPSVLGWIAIGAVSLFALILLTVLATGGDGLFGTTLLVIQLVVAGLVIAALLTRRGRMLGSIALAVALLANVGTAGALNALGTIASGGYALPAPGATTQPPGDPQAGYPGIKDLPPRQPLRQESLESADARADEALAAIRARLTEEFGFTWAPAGDMQTKPERNGYGGESMLVSYQSAQWATEEPVTGYPRKIEVMRAIDEVLAEHEFWGLIALNESGSGVDNATLEKFYGAEDPRDQPLWEWYSNDDPGPLEFYAHITDLSLDDTGEFRESREAQTEGTDIPLEGLRIGFIAEHMLSESDADAYRDAIEQYE